MSRQPVVLVTCFGPFPGAPSNPTMGIARALAKTTRQNFPGVTVVIAPLMTSYEAVARDVPALIARHRPDAVVHLGLAGRTRVLRVETRAVNRRNPLRVDAARLRPPDARVRPLGAPALMSTLNGPRTVARLRAARVPARLSRDAGDYLCNFVLYQTLDDARAGKGPAVAVFLHVPRPRRTTLRRGHPFAKRPDMAALIRGAALVIREAVVASRQRRRVLPIADASLA